MKILVIEDTPKHLDDAKKYSSQLIDCGVDFATTLTGALSLLEKSKYDGVISDIFFPKDEGSSAETYENALTLCRKLKEHDIYHVFNTSLHHHGKNDLMRFVEERENILREWNRSRIKQTFPLANLGNNDLYGGIMLIAYPLRYGHILESNIDKKEVDTKQWKGAFRLIIIANETRPIVTNETNAATIASLWMQYKSETINWDTFQEQMESNFHGIWIDGVYDGYDAGNTTRSLDHLSIQDVFRRFNA